MKREEPSFMDSGINVHYSMYKLVKGGPLCGSCANKLMHLSQYPLVGVNIKSNLFLNTFFVRFTCLICSIQNKSCSLCLSGGPKLLFTLTAEEQRGRGGINKDRRQHLYHTGRFSTKKRPLTTNNLSAFS